MSWQVNEFWNKVNKKNINENDIEKYIYSSEYFNIQNPVEYGKIKNEYNTNLIRYFFEIEKYQSERDYQEIFYQRFLDGDIDPNEYYDAEKSFKRFINYLFYKSNTYVYYEFLVPIEISYPFHKSSDVNFDFEFIKKNQEKFIQVIEKSQLDQISILFAREIVMGYIILTDIKSVLVCSGMHGYILSAEDLNLDLLHNISLQVKIKRINTLHN